MSKLAISMVVLLAALVIFSFAVFAFSFKERVKAEASFSINQPSTNDYFIIQDDLFMQSKCPSLGGTCTPGLWTCRENLGSYPVFFACEYQCTPAGIWGPGEKCSYNMCRGARCS